MWARAALAAIYLLIAELGSVNVAFGVIYLGLVNGEPSNDGPDRPDEDLAQKAGLFWPQFFGTAVIEEPSPKLNNTADGFGAEYVSKRTPMKVSKHVFVIDFTKEIRSDVAFFELFDFGNTKSPMEGAAQIIRGTIFGEESLSVPDSWIDKKGKFWRLSGDKYLGSDFYNNCRRSAIIYDVEYHQRLWGFIRKRFPVSEALRFRRYEGLWIASSARLKSTMR
jgi:hypothetical protein